MLIKEITLYNYRSYKGKNTIVFHFDDKKNIFLIFGENGFGKTTFLHSLLWCLYGRLSIDLGISEKKISVTNGYSSLLQSNLNNTLRKNLENIPAEVLSNIRRYGYSVETESIKSVSQYFVEVVFSQVAIPSIPCTNLTIRRSYDLLLEDERTEILIDGCKNELTTAIGHEIFINDFILNKDIARLFFFDSEQIVSLAETSSSAQKKRLSSAYNEVLGVKKYEDLRNNIDSVRVRFRKRSSDASMRNKIAELGGRNDTLKILISNAKSRVSEIDTEISMLTPLNDEYQLRLAREGHGVTIEEIKRLKAVVASTQKKDAEYKQLLKSYLEYAPLAICGSLLVATKSQLDADYQTYSNIVSQSNRNEMICNITSDLFLMLHKINLEENKQMEIQHRMQAILDKYKGNDNQNEVAIRITEADHRDFESLYNYITTTYKAEFERLVDDYKKNKQTWDRSSRRLANIENKENDELIQKLRGEKKTIENKLEALNIELRELLENIGTKTQELGMVQKQLSELLKKVDLEDIDSKKDELAGQLSAELNTFLVALKREKKFSLEERIRATLNNLMHKDNFIDHVEVNIVDDDMEIELYAADGTNIRKDSLSKGEQQLYATSILKALVDESGIKFPIFIDSPLQKFDKAHAAKIITDFYPTISSQVVLFPLLYKELTPDELKLMKPFVKSSYIIQNSGGCSTFVETDINSLMPSVYV